MKKISLIIAVAGAALTTPCVTAEGEGPQWWPQFRGPGALGVARSGEYPVEFDVDTDLIWKTALPSGVSSPCVWENHIFLTGHDEDREVLETICLDRKTGKIIWRKDAPAERIERVHEVSSPANATPASDGERVYVYFESYGLTAFDFEGNVVWTRELPLMQTRFGSGTSPIIANGLVILNRDGRPARWPFAASGSKPQLLAFDAKTGEVVWQADRPGSAVKYSTPVVWRHESGDQVLAMGSNRLTSYELSSGEETWWIGDLPPQVCATPQVIGSHVYVTATGMFGEPEAFVELPPFADFVKEHDKDEDGLISLAEIPDGLAVINRRASGGAGNSPLKQFARGIDRNRDRKIDEPEWNGFNERFGGFIKRTEPGVFALKLGGEGEVTKENIVWQNKRGVAEVPSLLVLGQQMFLVRNGGIVHCRNIANGDDVYRGRLGAAGGYYASPVAADGKVYFASDRGVVTVIDGHTPKLTVLARNDLKEPIMATPALVEGVIYFRTDGHLYAFGRP